MVTLALPPEPRSATRARNLTREFLAPSCPDDAIETAALLVTELVTNAVLHARTPMVLEVELSPGRVHLSVADLSTARPVTRTLEMDAATGRGLVLVEELSTSWGIERFDSGKQVWCEIAFPVAASANQGNR